MTVLEAAILGVVQGLTEFLPISSDGHLALAYRVMGSPPNLSFEVFLHSATLLAMVAYFWKDGVRLLSSLLPRNRERVYDRRLLGLITVATAITGGVAFAFSGAIERLSASMPMVGLGFLGTTVLLIIAEAADSRGTAVLEDENHLGYAQITLVGLLQGLAVLPGVSRSGSTISAAIFLGVAREEAARFSFLLGVPIIALAAAKDGIAVLGGASLLPQTSPLALAVGFCTAALTGYAAIWGLLRFVKNHSLYWFAAYTGVLGTAMLLGATVFGRG